MTSSSGTVAVNVWFKVLAKEQAKRERRKRERERDRAPMLRWRATVCGTQSFCRTASLCDRVRRRGGAKSLEELTQTVVWCFPLRTAQCLEFRERVPTVPLEKYIFLFSTRTTTGGNTNRPCSAAAHIECCHAFFAFHPGSSPGAVRGSPVSPHAGVLPEVPC